MIKVNGEQYNTVMYLEEDYDKVYYGKDLVYKKTITITGKLRGKFTDDSTSSDWWYCKNGTSSTKVNIANYVDPETKEFEVNIGTNNNTLKNLFYNNMKLERIYEVPNGDIATDCDAMFYYCTSLKSVAFPGFTGKNVTRIERMFYFCTALKSVSIPDFTGENVETINQLCYYCQSLVGLSLPNFNSRKINNIYWSIYVCPNIRYVRFNFEIVENARNPMFSSFNSGGYKYFTDIKNAGNFKIGCNFDLSPCQYLTNDSIMVVINALSDRDSTGTLKLYKTQYNELLEEQIALATFKGWTVSS